MMTKPYARLVSLPSLLHLTSTNKERNLRISYVATFWAGSFIGAIMTKRLSTWSIFVLAACSKMVASTWIYVRS